MQIDQDVNTIKNACVSMYYSWIYVRINNKHASGMKTRMYAPPTAEQKREVDSAVLEKY